MARHPSISGRLAAICLAFGFLAAYAGSSPLLAKDAPQPHSIALKVDRINHFQPGDSSKRVFGALEFRGGLVVSSPSKNFGGLSAISMQEDGETFLAVTDRGDWFRGRIVSQNGAPVDIAEAEMAPMLGKDGRALTDDGLFDAEALALDGGMAYVAFERRHQILRFDYASRGLLARGMPIPVPAEFSQLRNNRGIECLAAMPDKAPFAGSLLAIAEAPVAPEEHLRGFLIGGKKPARFTVIRHDGFDISDCTFLPDGDLLLLERFFSWQKGIAMRIRRVPLAAIAPGAHVDGEILITADMGYQIDIMEGLSVHQLTDGTVMLTLISDDNFSSLQRTLLLQFSLRPD